jgi:hypothetical protein
MSNIPPNLHDFMELQRTMAMTGGSLSAVQVFLFIMSIFMCLAGIVGVVINHVIWYNAARDEYENTARLAIYSQLFLQFCFSWGCSSCSRINILIYEEETQNRLIKCLTIL